VNVPLRRYWGLLVNYLTPQRSRVLLLALLLFGGIALQLINPQIVRAFIDTATSGGATEPLTGAALLFIGIAIAQQVVSVFTTYVGENVGWTATNALRADLTRHVLQLDMSFHKQRTPGELIERIDGDVTTLANFFSKLVIRVVGNMLLILAVLLLLFREDWRIGAGLSIYALITLGALGVIQRIAVPRWTAARQTSADLFGYLEERMSGTEDIRANGAEAYILYRLYGLMRRFLEKNRSAWMAVALSFVATRFLFVAGYALALALGAYLYMQGDVTIGTAFLIVYYMGILSKPLENIREQVDDLQQATASIYRVEELLQIQPQVRESTAVTRSVLPDGALAVAFDDVSFVYDDRGWRTEDGSAQFSVLHDISFTLAPGKVLGLLGRTGSGKTTITRLLFRLYDPSAGAIRLDSVDIRDVAIADLRGRVGMVTQDVQLFQANIRENMTFFNPRITDAELEYALRELGLGAWVQSLPDGLDTQLATGGQGLSAGEAQLLAFTRVFLKDPGLVILDEASSRLDPATEHLLERAIDRLLAGRTGIIIAHRLRTVQRADEILILEEGRIAELGPRPLLTSDPGSRFYHLLQTGAEHLEEALA
jgi:ATP-binding cassette subfamily B protein/ATP-binding cassette subfamily C protein